MSQPPSAEVFPCCLHCHQHTPPYRHKVRCWECLRLLALSHGMYDMYSMMADLRLLVARTTGDVTIALTAQVYGQWPTGADHGCDKGK